MDQNEKKATVRRHIERITGVNRTWFEWDWNHEAGRLAATLVVEVTFDTDPTAPSFDRSVLDTIEDTAKGVLADETFMTVGRLKIVPSGWA